MCRMSRIQNILAIVDPTADSQPALEKAARLAQAFEARLQVFACETKETRALRRAAHLQKGAAGDFISETYAVLEELAEPVRKRGIDVCLEVITGDPLYAQLLRRSQATSADVVVKDTHHHSVARRTFLSNTDWHLIRGCPVPLLLTKPRAWSGAPVIAAAVDPGHANDKPAVLDNRILDFAGDLKQHLGGELHVVHAFIPAILMAEAATGMPVLAGQLTQELMEDERKVKLAEVERVCGTYAVERQNIAVRFGIAADVLPQFAQEIAADVMVMGAISRSGLRRVFIGSTAERVLEYLPCDVLVVKSPDFAAALPF
jgi:universal stress protein E